MKIISFSNFMSCFALIFLALYLLLFIVRITFGSSMLRFLGACVRASFSILVCHIVVRLCIYPQIFFLPHRCFVRPRAFEAVSFHSGVHRCSSGRCLTATSSSSSARRCSGVRSTEAEASCTVDPGINRRSNASVSASHTSSGCTPAPAPLMPRLSSICRADPANKISPEQRKRREDANLASCSVVCFQTETRTRPLGGAAMSAELRAKVL